MSYLETVGQISRRLNLPGTLKTRLQQVLGKEVDFRQWFSRLPEDDRVNIRRLGNWLLGIIGEQGEVWAVGSSVHSVRRGKDTLGNDIDLQVYALCPNREMIELLENALRQTPPSGFALQKEPRFDQDSETPYFTTEILPVSGRVIHLLSPKPWEMTPEEERGFRRWPFLSGPFARFGKDYLNDLTMVYGS